MITETMQKLQKWFVSTDMMLTPKYSFEAVISESPEGEQIVSVVVDDEVIHQEPVDKFSLKSVIPILEMKDAEGDRE